MSLFTIIREFVLSIRTRRAQTHGGDSHASDSDSEEPSSECLAVRAAAQRAAQYENNNGEYPPAHARDGSSDVVLTFGEGHDWIRADSDDFVEVEQ